MRNKSVLPVSLIQKQLLIIRLIVKINSATVDVHFTHSEVSFHLIQKDISGFQKCTYCKKIRMFRRPVPSGKVEGTAQCFVFENINNDLSAFFGNGKGTVRNRMVLKPDIPFQFTWKNSAVGKRISDFYSTLINIRSKMNPVRKHLDIMPSGRRILLCQLMEQRLGLIHVREIWEQEEED